MKSFKELVEAQELQEKKGLEKVGQEIAYMTDRNDHMGALVLAASLLKDNSLYKAVEGLRAIADHMGSVDSSLRKIEEALRKQVMKQGWVAYGDDWEKYVYGNM